MVEALRGHGENPTVLCSALPRPRVRWPRRVLTTRLLGLSQRDHVMGAAGRGGLEKGDCNWAIGPRSPQAGGGRLTEAWNWGSWRELSQARRPPRGWDRVVGSGSGWVEGGSKALSSGVQGTLGVCAVQLCRGEGLSEGEQRQNP